jgi:hypothetical protein
MRIRALALAAVAAAPLAGLPTGQAAAATTATSTNWAGYAVTGARFRRVIGSWTVPKGNCAGSGDGYSAAWVGLGGFSSSSKSLEQTGTELDCVGGRARYSAWYELVPATARNVQLKVHAGDRIAAAVTVQGRKVTMTLRNRTTGASFRKLATMSAPDVSSAEWIVEAPAGCTSGGSCRQLPLADFGTLAFSGASATTTSGKTGRISRSAWSATKLNLVAGGAGPGAAKTASAGAAPSQLGGGGSSFAVTYQSVSPGAKSRSTLPALTRPAL